MNLPLTDEEKEIKKLEQYNSQDPPSGPSPRGKTRKGAVVQVETDELPWGMVWVGPEMNSTEEGLHLPTR